MMNTSTTDMTVPAADVSLQGHPGHSRGRSRRRGAAGPGKALARSRGGADTARHRWSGSLMAEQRFRDRAEAGRLLAAELGDFAHRPDVIVLGLPRGGVPVASEIARALDVALDVLIVRKLGMPGQEELAVGAVASGGLRVLNPEEAALVSDEELEQATRRARHEVERREVLYRKGLPDRRLSGKTVILVDDGAATGATMRAAIAAVRAQHPALLVVALPTAPPETCASLTTGVDELVCLMAPKLFFSVGQWYEDFSQCTDDEVCALLNAAGDPAKVCFTASPE